MMPQVCYSYFQNLFHFFNLQSGGSVGSIVVVGIVVVGGIVVGATVVGIGLASGGENSQISIQRNSTSSIATKPFPLFPRCTMN